MVDIDGLAAHADYLRQKLASNPEIGKGRLIKALAEERGICVGLNTMKKWFAAP